MIPRALILCLLVLSASSARAQEAPDATDDEAPAGDPEARADALTEEARAATAEGRHDEAARLLREALDLAPGAARAFNLSLVLRDGGEIVQAAETMDGVLQGEYGPLPEDRRVRAEEIRAELGARIATLVIRVSGAERVGLHLDDRPIADAIAGSPLRLSVNPGPHEVVARADDRATLSRTVTAVAGRSVTLDLDLEPIAPPADPVLPPPSTTEAQVDDTGGPSPWIFVAIGVAVALAAGGVALGFALSSSDEPPLPEDFLGRAETLRF